MLWVPVGRESSCRGKMEDEGNISSKMIEAEIYATLIRDILET